MAKHIVKGYVHLSHSSRPEDPKYAIFSFDMSSAGYPLVQAQEFEVDVPDDFNPVQAHVAMLEEKKRELRLRLANELRSIDEQISKLQAITYAPATV